MQGTAADIIKVAMLNIHRWLEDDERTVEEKKIKMIMQVHDELVFEVPTQCAQNTSRIICDLMSSAADLAVPLLVEADMGKNWDEAH